MRDEKEGIITFKGRVVYDRKKHLIKGKDVHRFTRSVQIPEDKVQAIALVYSISLIIGILYNINDFNLNEIINFSLPNLIRAEKSLTALREYWEVKQSEGRLFSFGGAGASGDF